MLPTTILIIGKTIKIISIIGSLIGTIMGFAIMLHGIVSQPVGLPAIIFGGFTLLFMFSMFCLLIN